MKHIVWHDNGSDILTIYDADGYMISRYKIHINEKWAPLDVRGKYSVLLRSTSVDLNWALCRLPYVVHSDSTISGEIVYFSDINLGAIIAAFELNMSSSGIMSKSKKSKRLIEFVAQFKDIEVARAAQALYEIGGQPDGLGYK
jgi:hypothetical protein